MLLPIWITSIVQNGIAFSAQKRLFAVFRGFVQLWAFKLRNPYSVQTGVTLGVPVCIKQRLLIRSL